MIIRPWSYLKFCCEGQYRVFFGVPLSFLFSLFSDLAHPGRSLEVYVIVAPRPFWSFMPLWADGKYC